MLSTKDSAKNTANSGVTAKTRKIATGSAFADQRARPDRTGAESAASLISAPLRGEEAGRGDVKHNRHQQVDQHRGERGADRAGGRRRQEQPHDVDREGTPERI